MSCNWAQLSEDVPCTGCFFSTLVPCAELANWQEHVNVVGGYEILSHSNDRGLQWNFTMMVSGVLSDITWELSNFDFLLKFSLKAREQDLSLPRLESIAKGRNGPGAVSNWELNQFFIDEVLVSQVLNVVIDIYIFLESFQPRLSLVSHLFVESQVYRLVIGLINVIEVYRVLHNLRKVFFRFFRCWGSKTFVVLDLVKRYIFILRPDLIVLDGEENRLLTAILSYGFDNWSHKLSHESFHPEQRRPEVMDEVDNEPFDMGTIMVLISHDHDTSVSELICILILLSNIDP